MLPKPSANMKEYHKILNQRLNDYPECRDNYEKYQKMCREGYQAECDYLPVKMDYEVSSHCNFRCTMCLMNEIGDHRPANMSFYDFKQSIDSQKGLVEVKLQGMGEPLLNPDFFKMVEYATANHIWVRTTTNASLLHLNDNYKKMIDAGIGEIQISIDGATKETFENIRIGSDFDLVVNNCIMMNSYAEAKGVIGGQAVGCWFRKIMSMKWNSCLNWRRK